MLASKPIKPYENILNTSHPFLVHVITLFNQTFYGAP